MNLDQNHDTASRNSVNGTPTIFFYRNGRLVDRVVGAVPRVEIARHLEALTTGRG
jgi:thioredoxin-like negative regulator of GroEL